MNVILSGIYVGDASGNTPPLRLTYQGASLRISLECFILHANINFNSAKHQIKYVCVHSAQNLPTHMFKKNKNNNISINVLLAQPMHNIDMMQSHQFVFI